MKEEKYIIDLIKNGENDQLEFKDSIENENIAKVICSFLNGKGGRVLVGVKDNGEIIGIKNAANNMENLKMYLLTAIIPESPITLSIEFIDNKNIIMLKVYGGANQPYLFEGNIYYRQDQNTIKATSKQISELIHNRQKTELHWERQSALGVELQDLDNKLILSTINDSRVNHRGNFEGNEIIDFLSNYGLYLNGSFTNACVVLFAKKPAKHIPQIRVRLTEFGKDKTDNSLLRDEIFEGNLFAIQENLERYIGNLGVRSIFDNNQWKRIDFKFPQKALQEGVINALIHRDYSSYSSSVSINIFPDSFVISNSGHLPDDLNISELKKSHRSHPVNPDIAHIVFLRGLIDKLGRGTLKIVDECRKEGLKDPVWKDSIDGITLTFNGPKALSVKKFPYHIKITNDAVNDTVNDAVNDAAFDKVYDAKMKGLIDTLLNETVNYSLIEALKVIILANKKGASINDIMSKTGKSNATVKRYLHKLKALHLAEFKGAAKTGKYYINEKVKSKININNE